MSEHRGLDIQRTVAKAREQNAQAPSKNVAVLHDPDNIDRLIAAAELAGKYITLADEYRKRAETAEKHLADIPKDAILRMYHMNATDADIRAVAGWIASIDWTQDTLQFRA